MRAAVLGMVVVTVGTSLATESAPPGWPASVAADLQAIATECTAAGGIAKTDEAVKRADLNGDGKDDYVLDVGSIQCDGAASVYGDRTKGLTVYVGDGADGARRAFEAWVYGAKLETAGAASRLWLTVAGQDCGRQPAADFASETFCDRYVVWNAKSQAFVFAPPSTIRVIQ